MDNRTQKMELLIILAIALGAVLINWRIAIGIAVGFVFSRFHMFMLSLRMNSIIDSSLDKGSANAFLIFFGGIIDTVILLIPFVLAYLFPMFIHWIGLAIGLLYDKMFLYISSLTKKED